MCTPTGSDLDKRLSRQRLLEPVVRRLKAITGSGLSPRDLTRTLCLGAAIGLLPLIWGTSLLCLLLAHRFKLNHLVLQSVNYLLYPVQLVLLLPFCRLGLQWFPWGPTLPVCNPVTLFQNSSGAGLSLFLWLNLKAIGAWMITVPPLALLLYLVLLVTVVKKREAASPATTAAALL